MRKTQRKAPVDEDIDSYLEAQLIEDIKSSKTKEVKTAAPARNPKPVRKAVAEETYDCVVEDSKLPDN